MIHKLKDWNGIYQFKHGESENRSPESQGPILKALGTQKTLISTENLISGYYLNVNPGVIWGEIVTLDVNTRIRLGYLCISLSAYLLL